MIDSLSNFCYSGGMEGKQSWLRKETVFFAVTQLLLLWPKQEPKARYHVFGEGVQEKRELQQIHAGKSVKLKRRYNNNKRKMLAGSRQSSRGAIQKSRQDEHRVRALVEQPSCTCSLEHASLNFCPSSAI